MYKFDFMVLTQHYKGKLLTKEEIALLQLIDSCASKIHLSNAATKSNNNLSVTQQIQLAKSLALGHLAANIAEGQVITRSVKPTEEDEEGLIEEDEEVINNMEESEPRPQISEPSEVIPQVVSSNEGEVTPPGEKINNNTLVDDDDSSGRIKKKVRLNTEEKQSIQSSEHDETGVVSDILKKGRLRAIARNVCVPSTELDSALFASEGLLQSSSLDIAAIASSALTELQAEGSENTSSLLPFEYKLLNFGFDNVSTTQCNHTLVMKVSVPRGAKRWCINFLNDEKNHVYEQQNISSDHSVLFHFNPRCDKESRVSPHVLLNTRYVSWSKAAIKIFPDRFNTEWLSYILGEHPDTPFELMIQIYSGGFAVFVNGVFGVAFPHRMPIGGTGGEDSEHGQSLLLHVPLVEDIRDTPENIIVHQIWWGKRDYSLDESKIPTDVLRSVLQSDRIESTTAFFTAEKSKCLQISGFPEFMLCSECTALEHLLYELFNDYSSNIRGTYIPKGRGVGFVKFDDEQTASAALSSTPETTIETPSGDKITLRASALM